MSTQPCRQQILCWCTATALATTLVAPTMAQDERAPGWYDEAQLSFVQTAGNTESSTLGFDNKLERLWENAKFELTLGALRAESDLRTRTAIATADGFRVQESSSSALTAERYYVRARYDHALSATTLWFVGGGWERNEFAGFESRYSAVGGFGNVWWDTERSRLETDYGLTYTRQLDLIESSEIDEGFLGIRLGLDFRQTIGSNAEYSLGLVTDGNLDETEDLRAELVNALRVSMNNRLALRISYQLAFDNLPALERLPIQGAAFPPGATVTVPLDEVDSIFTAALVISWHGTR
jgi:putative salt-induced outer membrane protein YdiY